jgi:uncharacterized LabA/DUF88 family protein
MDNAVVLIDGGYLDALNRDVFGKKRIDLLRLSEELCKPDCERFRTYYYHCPPYQDDPPTPEQQIKKAGYDKYVSRLQRKPRFVVREGRLRLLSRTPFKVEQKGVDVLFACDLVRLAAKNVIQKAIILGGDADYVPAVKIAKEEMVLTKVVYVPGHCSPHLFQACDERSRLTQTMIDLVSF